MDANIIAKNLTPQNRKKNNEKAGGIPSCFFLLKCPPAWSGHFCHPGETNGNGQRFFILGCGLDFPSCVLTIAAAMDNPVVQ